MYEDSHLEMDFEDRSDSSYDPYGYDYPDEEDEEDTPDEEYGWPVSEPFPAIPDDLPEWDGEDMVHDMPKPPKPDVCPECLLPTHKFGCWPLSDDSIGVATFETSDAQSDEYRRALQVAQFGYLI